MGVKPSDRSNRHTLILSQLHLDLRDLDLFLMKKDRGSKVDHQYVTSEIFIFYMTVICVKAHNKIHEYYLKMSTATCAQMITKKK